MAKTTARMMSRSPTTPPTTPPTMAPTLVFFLDPCEDEPLPVSVFPGATLAVATLVVVYSTDPLTVLINVEYTTLGSGSD